ncbi:MAG: hypothetical protein ACK46H_02585 [Bacteroidota bacterium]
MKAKTWTLTMMLGLVPVFAMAQTEDTEAISPNPVDTVAWNLKDSIRMALASVPSYSMWLDSRNSFISADPVNVFGLRYGLSWGKISAYTGYYFTSYNQGIAGDSIQYKFNYISSTYEYRLYKTHRFSLTGFAQLGGGIRTVNHLTNENIANKQQFFMPIEFGAYGSVRFLRYFGVGGGLGTRIALFPGGRNFSGPIYYLGFTAVPWTFYEDVRKKANKHGMNLP